MMGLTQKQQQVFQFLADRIGNTGIAPSYEEIAKELGITSNAIVMRHLDELMARGYIRRIPHKARAIEILGQPSSVRLSSQVTELLNKCAKKEGVKPETLAEEAIRSYLGEAA